MHTLLQFLDYLQLYFAPGSRQFLDLSSQILGQILQDYGFGLQLFAYGALVGLFAGLASGLFGIGGGSIIVPAVSLMLAGSPTPPEHVMLTAVATSLAAALFSSAASVYGHNKFGLIDWRRVARLTPCLLAGAAAGAALAELIKGEILRWLFISYLCHTSLQLLRARKTAVTAAKRQLNDWLDYPVGLLIGALSSILGIGGGAITVPYLTHRGLGIKQAVSISSACALPIAASGAISYALLGVRHHPDAAGSLGYICLPAFAGIIATSIFTAPIGARLAHRLPALHLKRYFAVLLILVAIKMGAS